MLQKKRRTRGKKLKAEGEIYQLRKLFLYWWRKHSTESIFPRICYSHPVFPPYFGLKNGDFSCEGYFFHGSLIDALSGFK